jgi:glycosyltransferase involved in cell wall biosynthesis
MVDDKLVTDQNPAVTVLVPCRNEEHHIEACVRSILQQERYRGDFEIFVVDGMSDDATRMILARMAKENATLRLLDNPRKAKPYGLNMAIQMARGGYIAILDAHTEYAPDYLRTCLQLFEEHPEVSCVGGPIVSEGQGLFGRAVAAVMSHPVGIGNAKHRLPNYEGYAEGACFPMFRKEVFEKVGLYDERLVRNQDDELNYRLAQLGEKVFISPRARCRYFVREKPSQLFQQYFQYGFWRVAVLRKHRLPASVRQIIPPAFMLLTVISFIVGLSSPGMWRLTGIVLPLVYGTTLAGVGGRVGCRSGWQVGLLFPVAAAIIHVAYAVGFAMGVLKGGNSLGYNRQVTKGECYESRT